MIFFMITEPCQRISLTTFRDHEVSATGAAPGRITTVGEDRQAGIR